VRPLRRAAIGLGALFFVLGLAGASFVSRIPAIKTHGHLSNGALGVALVGVPVGSVIASVAVSRLLHVRGSRQVVVAGVVLSAISLVPPVLVDDLPALVVALAALGVGVGLLDIAMNTHGVTVERATGRSLFGRLHGMWSLGSATGAGLAAAAIAAGMSPRMHLAIAALVTLGGGSLAAACLLPEPPRAEAEVATGLAHPRGWSRNPLVLALAVAALSSFVVEGAAGDWSGVYLRDVTDAPGTLLPLGYAMFAAVQFSVRMVGDRFIERFGGPTLLVAGSTMAAMGWLGVVATTAPGAALVGFGLVGGGSALVVPVAFATSGRVPGVLPARGVATAAGIAYVGWGLGPPAVGALASAVGLRGALVLPAAVSAVGALVVHRVRRRM
jgi:MFS transporter